MMLRRAGWCILLTAIVLLATPGSEAMGKRLRKRPFLLRAHVVDFETGAHPRLRVRRRRFRAYKTHTIEFDVYQRGRSGSERPTHIKLYLPNGDLLQRARPRALRRRIDSQASPPDGDGPGTSFRHDDYALRALWQVARGSLLGDRLGDVVPTRAQVQDTLSSATKLSCIIPLLMRIMRGVSVVACLSGFLGASCATEEAPNTLIFASSADATTLDPHNTTDSQSDQVIWML